MYEKVAKHIDAHGLVVTGDKAPFIGIDTDLFRILRYRNSVG